jgi:hypothetical protein
MIAENEPPKNSGLFSEEALNMRYKKKINSSRKKIRRMVSNLSKLFKTLIIISHEKSI